MNELIYAVQVAPTIKSLTEQVQTALNGGWLPVGGLTNYGGAWHQAMILEIGVSQEEIDAGIDDELEEMLENELGEDILKTDSTS